MISERRLSAYFICLRNCRSRFAHQEHNSPTPLEYQQQFPTPVRVPTSRNTVEREKTYSGANPTASQVGILEYEAMHDSEKIDPKTKQKKKKKKKKKKREKKGVNRECHQVSTCRARRDESLPKNSVSFNTVSIIPQASQERAQSNFLDAFIDRVPDILSRIGCNAC